MIFNVVLPRDKYMWVYKQVILFCYDLGFVCKKLTFLQHWWHQEELL